MKDIFDHYAKPVPLWRAANQDFVLSVTSGVWIRPCMLEVGDNLYHLYLFPLALHFGRRSKSGGVIPLTPGANGRVLPYGLSLPCDGWGDLLNGVRDACLRWGHRSINVFPAFIRTKPRTYLRGVK